MALTEGHDKIEFIRVLERELQRYDKRIIHESKDCALREDMCDLPRSACNMGFSNGLQSVNPLGVLLSDLHDLSEASLTDDLEKLEGLDRQALSARLEPNLEVELPRTGRGDIPLVAHMMSLPIQDGTDLNTAHQQIVPHVVVPLYALRCPQVRRDDDAARTRDVEMCAVVPDGRGEVAIERIDEDFVLVEFEYDVG